LDYAGPCRCAPTCLAYPQPAPQRTFVMNQIVWIVGAVVIVLFVLGFFGLR
jgi:hypothetical protein